MSSSYSSATLNTQLSTDSTQHIPNMYHHNSLVDTLSAGSVVSYTSTFLAMQQNAGDGTEFTESSPSPRSGIYVGTTIVEELNEGVGQNADEENIKESHEDEGDDKKSEKKISCNSSNVSEAEECLEHSPASMFSEKESQKTEKD